MEDKFLYTGCELVYSKSDGNLHEVQLKLLNHVNENPGIRYRELLRLTNCANGTMSYHLAELEKSSKIAVIRKKNVTRYYPSDMSQQVSNVISYLRNPISRQIISLLVSKDDGCAFDEFTRSITRAPSTIHWHLQRLIDAGIIKKDFMHYSDGSNRSSRLYYLPEREIVKDILSKYVETPLDKLVANYSNLMDDL